MTKRKLEFINDLQIESLDWSALRNCTELNISGNDLTAIPEGICLLPKLQVLVANDNQLKTLPDFLSKLKDLRMIVLRNNKFSEFPQLLLDIA
jgi:Leucine-rich repeat (LRR) protein